MRRHAVLAASALVLTLSIPLLAGPLHAGQYSCPNGGAPRANRTCPDGSMALYKADEVKPNRQTSPLRPTQSGTIEQHRATEVKPLTPAERQRMLENDRRAGKELAKKISPDGTLNPQQLKALETQRCLQAAAVNPGVRCVPR